MSVPGSFLRLAGITLLALLLTPAPAFGFATCQADDQEAARARQALLDQMRASEVRETVEDVRLHVEGMEQEQARKLAKVLATLRDAMYAEGQNELFTGSRDLRVRQRPQQASNFYCGGLAAMTLIVPGPETLLDGGGHDVAWTMLEMAMEAQWSRIVRPVWSMPSSIRMALDRALVEHYLPTVVSEHGADWWLGEATPTGTPWALAADHPVLADRDALLVRLRRFIAIRGIDDLLVALNHWNAVRFTGEEAAAHLAELLHEKGAEGEEEAEVQPLLPAVEFATREPWQGIDGARLEGVQYKLNKRSSSVHARFWYGKDKGIPKEFVSVRGGAPTMALRVSEEGSWRFTDAEVVLRRFGTFEPDQQFFVVLLDRHGHELFRWGYLLHHLPEQADWLVLENTATPAVPTEYLVALDFPDLREGQDVEIGVTSGAKGGEHSFRSAPGRRLEAIEEGRDWAAVIQLSGAQIHPRRADYLVARALKGQ